MKKIKIKTPAKINLTLEVLNKRPDGFHNIKSIMQTISLYDFLTFEIMESPENSIVLSGNSKEIPYDEKNLVYKAAIKFFEKSGIKNYDLKINIEKNIPVSAGLAGGSSNAAGTFYALNKLFNEPFATHQLNELCASLGSDLNFCLKGGCCLCSSRGEIIEPLPVYSQKVSLIKPKNIGISAKEAYTKFSLLNDKSNPNNTDKLIELLNQGKFDEKLLYNSFEKALFPDYVELQTIKNSIKNSLMSGSGSTFFVLSDKINFLAKVATSQNDDLREHVLNINDYQIFENLETTQNGIMEC